jgi:hypothetical protein
VVNAIHNGPVLLAQTDVTVMELTTLTVTNTAIDTDLPPLGLVYSLVNPPAGASIDTSGVITWTPDEAQGPSTNTLTTVVTDNGVPPLSATNSFTVTVVSPAKPPTITWIMNNGDVVLTWDSTAGTTYRLQYKNQLEETDWLDQLPDVTATGSVTTVTNTLNSHTSGYFRILVVP